MFASSLGTDWQSLVDEKGLTNIQHLISVLIQSFIGDGISDQGRYVKESILKSPNVHFSIPALVGKLLGVSGAHAAKDIYNFIFGIQTYGTNSNVNQVTGLNPVHLTAKYNRIWFTNVLCSGDSLVKPEFWNQVKAWSIINQYTNAPLNEIFTSFRISPNGNVMPTMVLRQIPFTTEDFIGSELAVTKFLNLPRWHIDNALIFDEDIGREEAARINFVQYFGRSSISNNGSDISEEIARGNYVYDVADVTRSGLRPYIVTTMFDEPTTLYKEYRSPDWAKIVGDTVLGGHLKLNGSILTAGIVDPIAVGDNLELSGIVYHIEQINHTCMIGPDGRRTFRTSLSLSNGMSVLSTTHGTRYGEMTHTVANALREVDYSQDQILPGVSEAQDTVYRQTNPDLNDAPDATSDVPFPQPGPPVKSEKKKPGAPSNG